MKGRMTTGDPREGGALLAGLLRCGRCGRKFQVHYSGKYGTAHYRCRGANQRQAAPSCLSLRGRDLDQAMEEENDDTFTDAFAIRRILDHLGLSTPVVGKPPPLREVLRVAEQAEVGACRRSGNEPKPAIFGCSRLRGVPCVHVEVGGSADAGGLLAPPVRLPRRLTRPRRLTPLAPSAAPATASRAHMPDRIAYRSSRPRTRA